MTTFLTGGSIYGVSGVYVFTNTIAVAGVVTPFTVFVIVFAALSVPLPSSVTSIVTVYTVPSYVYPAALPATSLISKTYVPAFVNVKVPKSMLPSALLLILPVGRPL